MVRIIRLAKDKEPADIAFEIVVNPESAHDVMRCWVNAHWLFVRILCGDAFVHFEEVSVTLADRFFTPMLDSVAEVEVHAPSAGTHASAFVADLFGRTGR